MLRAYSMHRLTSLYRVQLTMPACMDTGIVKMSAWLERRCDKEYRVSMASGVSHTHTCASTIVNVSERCSKRHRLTPLYQHIGNVHARAHARRQVSAVESAIMPEPRFLMCLYGRWSHRWSLTSSVKGASWSCASWTQRRRIRIWYSTRCLFNEEEYKLNDVHVIDVWQLTDVMRH
jgi:hypothetical protein